MNQPTIEIIHGDCLEVLKDEKYKEAFDLILTDPPYGIFGKLDKIFKKKYDKFIKFSEVDIAITPMELRNAFYPVIKHKGYAIFFSQEPYTHKLIGIFTKCDPLFLYKMTWNKLNFANVLSCKKAPVSITEDIIITNKLHGIKQNEDLRNYFKSIVDYIGETPNQISKILGHKKCQHSVTYNGIQFSLCSKNAYQELTKFFNLKFMEGYKEYETLYKMIVRKKKTYNVLGKFNYNLLTFEKDYNGKHPTQKPVALLEELIRIYTNPGDTILDPFAGSGSTAIACKKTGRNCIIIEKDKEYYEIAKTWINETETGMTPEKININQLTLF